MFIGGLVGLLVFGIGFLALAAIAATPLGEQLTMEDGPIEWLGAFAFLMASILQFILFWRSDVPKSQRLLPFMRRNVFYLGVATVLFFGFVEEISWGQRIFGWATPDDLIVRNVQNETNLHNLEWFQGASLLNINRLFNLFWLGYCVVLPIFRASVPALAALLRRISLPMVPYWVGGLFVGAFVAQKVYDILQPAGAIASGYELAEAFIAVCFVALGVAQIVESRPGPAAGSLSATAQAR
jgi:hypothetical protein